LSPLVPEHFEDWFVRNSAQQMVPFDAFSTGVWIQGSPKLERYNGRSSFEILGEPASGQSSGTAMKTMEELAGKLPHGIGFDWTGLSYEERAGSSQVAMLYAISLAVVFLCLAALYESWSIPVAVLLAVPPGVLGTALATTFRGLENDVFFQVGLSAKNAILIVEFARANFERGMSSRRCGQPCRFAAITADPDDILRIHHGCPPSGRFQPVQVPAAITPLEQR
jgi:multidrug efflux pump subunit AcrB